MNWKFASHSIFGLTFITIGLIGLASGTFAPIWNPVPETVPARDVLQWITVLVAVGCGAGLLARRTAALAALALLAFLFVWTAFFKVPFIIRAPLEEVSYQSTGENAVLIAGAWVLYCAFSRNQRFPAGKAGVRLAYALYSLALIAFGLSHFVYLEMTAPLVPSWLPGPVFWAYGTGAIYLACGFVILVGSTRWGSIAAALQIGLITVLVWGPIVIAGKLSAMHWQETIVSVALTAAALVLASESPPKTAVFRVPFR